MRPNVPSELVSDLLARREFEEIRLLLKQSPTTEKVEFEKNGVRLAPNEKGQLVFYDADYPNGITLKELKG